MKCKGEINNMCKCCEYIKDLQEIENTHKEIPGIKHITLKEMLEEIVQCILAKKEIENYYYRDGEGNYKKITEVDLFYRIGTEDGDFTEFEWELEESNLYKEDKQ